MIDQKRQALLADPEYREKSEIQKQETRYYPECTVLGYRVLQIAKEKVAICIDADDPYVGHRSKHRQLSQRDERLESARHDREYRQRLLKKDGAK